MSIDYFGEFLNVVYIAKTLHNMGRYELVKKSFSDRMDYDFYYGDMYDLIENLFEHHDCNYRERYNMEYHVLSDPVIVDFYILAGEYGRRNNIPDEINPYIKEAEKQANVHLNFSYCLDWKLVGHTKPRRPFHSRLGLFLYQDDYVNLGFLAYRLVELYDWFSRQCVELNILLYGRVTGKEAIAA